MTALAGGFLRWILVGLADVLVTLPTAEVYYVLTGIWMLFTILSGFAMWTGTVRGRRIGSYARDNHWDTDAANYFWELTYFAWIGMYVI